MSNQDLQQWMAEHEQPDHKSDNFHANEKVRYEQLKNEVQNARTALLRAEVFAHEIKVENLPGDIVGKTEAMRIAVDPVVFRDLTFATHTLAHEKAHKSGIANEGLAELAAIMKAKDASMPEYVAFTENVRKVADTVGWQTTLDLYEQKSYEFMFKIFVSKSMKTGKSYTQCIKEFEAAFPELEVLAQKN